LYPTGSNLDHDARLGVGGAGDSRIKLGNAAVVIEAPMDSENRLTSAVTAWRDIRCRQEKSSKHSVST
jgi:hypothetical protein